MSQIKQLSEDNIVYIDEAGIDNRLYQPYARSKRGQKIYANICGRKKERISIIGALNNKRFIAPFTFQGGCNTEVFNTWLEQVLLPELSPGMTIILDNAAFHKSAKTRLLIEQAHCHLLFLPPYSPDFNPIEHWWHKIKSFLRPIIQNAQINLQSALNQALLSC